jgi:hypothetical protein
MPRGMARPASDSLGAPSETPGSRESPDVRRDRGGALRGEHTVMAWRSVFGDEQAAGDSVLRGMHRSGGTRGETCTEKPSSGEDAMRAGPPAMRAVQTRWQARRQPTG